MILTGPEILKQRHEGVLSIDPFDVEQLNPNSYNCRLHNELVVYLPRGETNLVDWIACDTPLPVATLDCRLDNSIYRFEIPDEGFVLYPGKLYLGATVERTGTDVFVPMIDGRSSLARLGLSIHQTGGFGDVGFAGTWTLELTCVEPVRIYAGMEICQVQFWECKGEVTPYKGKYLGQCVPTPSKIYEELTPSNEDDQ